VRLSPPTGRHLAPVAGRVRAACAHCRTGGLAAPAGPALAAAVPARSCLTPLRKIPPAWAPSG